MVLVELLCDHPDCKNKVGQVLETAPNVTDAMNLVRSGSVRCPEHGIRTDPVLVGRPGRPGEP